MKEEEKKTDSPAMLQRVFRAAQTTQARFSFGEVEAVVCGGHTHLVPRDLHESQICMCYQRVGTQV